MTIRQSLIAALFCAAALPLQAQTFAVSLGETTLGQLVHTKKSGTVSLNLTLKDTPLGVFNGAFRSTSKKVTAEDGKRVREFVSKSKSSRNTREVHLRILKGKPVSATILPESAQTSLSDPTNVKGSVKDPAMAIGALLWAKKGCPPLVTIYDGRRAIALQPQSNELVDGQLICKIKYKVVAGPGHLSPLNVSTAKMQLTYAVEGKSQRITQMRLGSGPFNVVLNRVD